MSNWSRGNSEEISKRYPEELQRDKWAKVDGNFNYNGRTIQTQVKKFMK